MLTSSHCRKQQHFVAFFQRSFAVFQLPYVRVVVHEEVYETLQSAIRVKNLVSEGLHGINAWLTSLFLLEYAIMTNILVRPVTVMDILHIL